MDTSWLTFSVRTKLLVILIVIGLVAVAWAIYQSMPRQYGSHGPSGLAIIPSRVGDNWSLLVDDTPAGFALSTMTLTITNSSGIIIAPMDSVPILSLDIANWTTYHALFTKVGTENEVTKGERVLIGINAYPGRIYYELRRNAIVVATGSLA